MTKLWDATKPLDWQVTTRKPPADWRSRALTIARGRRARPFLYSVEKKPDPKKSGEVHRWLRREFDVPEAALKRVQVWMVGENEAEMYINGVLAVTCGRTPARGIRSSSRQPVKRAQARPKPGGDSHEAGPPLRGSWLG